MQTINIGGKSRPIRYSHRALRMLAVELNANTFQQLGEKVSGIGIQDIPFLTWIGLKEGARFLKEPFEFKTEDVGEWLDDEPAGKFQEVMTIFGADFSGEQPEADEKKQTAKTTKK